MQPPSSSSWSGRLCVKGLFACMAQIDQEDQADILSNWGSYLNIKWKTKTVCAKEKFLPGLTEFPQHKELQWNGWFVNGFSLKPSKCPTNFVKLINYFRKNSSTTVLKHDDEVLLMSDSHQMAQMCGYVKMGSKREDTLMCLLLSKTSKRTNQAKLSTKISYQWLHENVVDDHHHAEGPESSRLQPEDVQKAFPLHNSALPDTGASKHRTKQPEIKIRQQSTHKNLQDHSASSKQKTPRKRPHSSSSSDTEGRSYADRIKDLSVKLSSIEESSSDEDDSTQTDSSDKYFASGKAILEKACKSYCQKLYATFSSKEPDHSLPKKLKIQPSPERKPITHHEIEKKVKHTHSTKENKDIDRNDVKKNILEKKLSEQDLNAFFREPKKKKQSESVNIFDKYSDEMSQAQKQESTSLKSQLKEKEKSHKSHHHKKKKSSSSRDQEPDQIPSISHKKTPSSSMLPSAKEYTHKTKVKKVSRIDKQKTEAEKVFSSMSIGYTRKDISQIGRIPKKSKVPKPSIQPASSIVTTASIHKEPTGLVSLKDLVSSMKSSPNLARQELSPDGTFETLTRDTADSIETVQKSNSSTDFNNEALNRTISGNWNDSEEPVIKKETADSIAFSKAFLRTDCNTTAGDMLSKSPTLPNVVTAENMDRSSWPFAQVQVSPELEQMAMKICSPVSVKLVKIDHSLTPKLKKQLRALSPHKTSKTGAEKTHSKTTHSEKIHSKKTHSKKINSNKTNKIVKGVDSSSFDDFHMDMEKIDCSDEEELSHMDVGEDNDYRGGNDFPLLSEKGDGYDLLGGVSDSGSMQRLIMQTVSSDRMVGRSRHEDKSEKQSCEGLQTIPWMKSVLNRDGKGDMIPGLGDLDEIGKTAPLWKSGKKYKRTVVKTSTNIKVAVLGVDVDTPLGKDKLQIEDIVKMSLHRTALYGDLMSERDLLVCRSVNYVLHQPRASSTRHITKQYDLAKNYSYLIRTDMVDRVRDTDTEEQDTDTSLDKTRRDVSSEIENIMRTKRVNVPSVLTSDYNENVKSTNIVSPIKDNNQLLKDVTEPKHTEALKDSTNLTKENRFGFKTRKQSKNTEIRDKTMAASTEEDESVGEIEEDPVLEEHQKMIDGMLKKKSRKATRWDLEWSEECEKKGQPSSKADDRKADSSRENTSSSDADEKREWSNDRRIPVIGSLEHKLYLSESFEPKVKERHESGSGRYSPITYGSDWMSRSKDASVDHIDRNSNSRERSIDSDRRSGSKEISVERLRRDSDSKEHLEDRNRRSRSKETTVERIRRESGSKDQLKDCNRRSRSKETTVERIRRESGSKEESYDRKRRSRSKETTVERIRRESGSKDRLEDHNRSNHGKRRSRSKEMTVEPKKRDYHSREQSIDSDRRSGSTDKTTKEHIRDSRDKTGDRNRRSKSKESSVEQVRKESGSKAHLDNHNRRSVSKETSVVSLRRDSDSREPTVNRERRSRSKEKSAESISRESGSKGQDDRNRRSRELNTDRSRRSRSKEKSAESISRESGSKGQDDHNRRSRDLPSDRSRRSGSKEILVENIKKDVYSKESSSEKSQSGKKEASVTSICQKSNRKVTSGEITRLESDKQKPSADNARESSVECTKNKPSSSKQSEKQTVNPCKKDTSVGPVEINLEIKSTKSLEERLRNISSSSELPIITKKDKAGSTEKSTDKGKQKSGNKVKGSKDSTTTLKKSGQFAEAEAKEAKTEAVGKRLENLAASEPSRVEKRQKRQFHPYRKEESKAAPSRNTPSWSFDIAYSDMQELLQNFTESQFLLKGKKPADVSQWKKPVGRKRRNRTRSGSPRNANTNQGRFSGFKFTRAPVPRSPVHGDRSSDEDDDSIRPDMIPDLEERQRRADIVEELFMGEGEEDEEYNKEKTIYDTDTTGAPDDKRVLVCAETATKGPVQVTVSINSEENSKASKHQVEAKPDTVTKTTAPPPKLATTSKDKPINDKQVLADKDRKSPEKSRKSSEVNQTTDRRVVTADTRKVKMVNKSESNDITISVGKSPVKSDTSRSTSSSKTASSSKDIPVKVELSVSGKSQSSITGKNDPVKVELSVIEKPKSQVRKEGKHGRDKTGDKEKDARTEEETDEDEPCYIITDELSDEQEPWDAHMAEVEEIHLTDTESEPCFIVKSDLSGEYDVDHIDKDKDKTFKSDVERAIEEHFAEKIRQKLDTDTNINKEKSDIEKAIDDHFADKLKQKVKTNKEKENMSDIEKAIEEHFAEKDKQMIESESVLIKEHENSDIEKVIDEHFAVKDTNTIENASETGISKVNKERSDVEKTKEAHFTNEDYQALKNDSDNVKENELQASGLSSQQNVGNINDTQNKLTSDTEPRVKLVASDSKSQDSSKQSDSELPENQTSSTDKESYSVASSHIDSVKPGNIVESRNEYKKVLSAYEIHSHLQPSYTHNKECKQKESPVEQSHTTHNSSQNELNADENAPSQCDHSLDSGHEKHTVNKEEPKNGDHVDFPSQEKYVMDADKLKQYEHLQLYNQEEQPVSTFELIQSSQSRQSSSQSSQPSCLSRQSSSQSSQSSSLSCQSSSQSSQPSSQSSQPSSLSRQSSSQASQPCSHSSQPSSQLSQPSSQGEQTVDTDETSINVKSLLASTEDLKTLSTEVLSQSDCTPVSSQGNQTGSSDYLSQGDLSSITSEEVQKIVNSENLSQSDFTPISSQGNQTVSNDRLNFSDISSLSRQEVREIVSTEEIFVCDHSRSSNQDKLAVTTDKLRQSNHTQLSSQDDELNMNTNKPCQSDHSQPSSQDGQSMSTGELNQSIDSQMSIQEDKRIVNIGEINHSDFTPASSQVKQTVSLDNLCQSECTKLFSQDKPSLNTDESDTNQIPCPKQTADFCQTEHTQSSQCEQTLSSDRLSHDDLSFLSSQENREIVNTEELTQIGHTLLSSQDMQTVNAEKLSQNENIKLSSQEMYSVSADRLSQSGHSLLSSQDKQDVHSEESMQCDHSSTSSQFEMKTISSIEMSNSDCYPFSSQDTDMSQSDYSSLSSYNDMKTLSAAEISQSESTSLSSYNDMKTLSAAEISQSDSTSVSSQNEPTLSTDKLSQSSQDSREKESINEMRQNACVPIFCQDNQSMNNIQNDCHENQDKTCTKEVGQNYSNSLPSFVPTLLDPTSSRSDRLSNEINISENTFDEIQNTSKCFSPRTNESNQHKFYPKSVNLNTDSVDENAHVSLSVNTDELQPATIISVESAENNKDLSAFEIQRHSGLYCSQPYHHCTELKLHSTQPDLHRNQSGLHLTQSDLSCTQSDISCIQSNLHSAQPTTLTSYSNALNKLKSYTNLTNEDTDNNTKANAREFAEYETSDQSLCKEPVASSENNKGNDPIKVRTLSEEIETYYKILEPTNTVPEVSVKHSEVDENRQINKIELKVSDKVSTKSVSHDTEAEYSDDTQGNESKDSKVTALNTVDLNNRVSTIYAGLQNTTDHTYSWTVTENRRTTADSEQITKSESSNETPSDSLQCLTDLNISNKSKQVEKQDSSSFKAGEGRKREEPNNMPNALVNISQIPSQSSISDIQYTDPDKDNSIVTKSTEEINRKVTDKIDNSTLRVENKKVLSAYETHRHLETFCSHPVISNYTSQTEHGDLTNVSNQTPEVDMGKPSSQTIFSDSNSDTDLKPSSSKSVQSIYKSKPKISFRTTPKSSGNSKLTDHKKSHPDKLKDKLPDCHLNSDSNFSVTTVNTEEAVGSQPFILTSTNTSLCLIDSEYSDITSSSDTDTEKVKLVKKVKSYANIPVDRTTSKAAKSDKEMTDTTKLLDSDRASGTVNFSNEPKEIIKLSDTHRADLPVSASETADSDKEQKGTIQLSDSDRADLSASETANSNKEPKEIILFADSDSALGGVNPSTSKSDQIAKSDKEPRETMKLSEGDTVLDKEKQRDSSAMTLESKKPESTEKTSSTMLGEHKNALSAYELHRQLEPSCTQTSSTALLSPSGAISPCSDRDQEFGRESCDQKNSPSVSTESTDNKDEAGIAGKTARSRRRPAHKQMTNISSPVQSIPPLSATDPKHSPHYQQSFVPYRQGSPRQTFVPFPALGSPPMWSSPNFSTFRHSPPARGPLSNMSSPYFPMGSPQYNSMWSPQYLHQGYPWQTLPPPRPFGYVPPGSTLPPFQPLIAPSQPHTAPFQPQTTPQQPQPPSLPEGSSSHPYEFLQFYAQFLKNMSNTKDKK